MNKVEWAGDDKNLRDFERNAVAVTNLISFNQLVQ